MIAATLLLYIVKTIPEARKQLLPTENLNLIEFDSEKSVIFGNFGDQKLYLRNVTLITDTGNTWIGSEIQIDRFLEPGEIDVHSVETQKKMLLDLSEI